MKIYIETDMTELPKSCRSCPVNEEWAKGYRLCVIKDIYDKHGQNARPSWCPLRTETEIVEKVNKNVPEKLYGVYGEDIEGTPRNKPHKVFSDVKKAKEYAISQKGKIAWGIAPVYEICSKKVYEKVKKIDVIE